MNELIELFMELTEEEKKQVLADLESGEWKQKLLQS